MSDRDDPANPYGRASAWPQMPQAPFRVGPLPKAAPQPPPQPPSPRSSILTGSAVPMGRVAPAAAPAPPPAPDTGAESFDLPPPPFAAGPVSRGRRRASLRDRIPLISAVAVGAAGVAVSAVVFLGHRPAPQPVPAEEAHLPTTIVAPPSEPPAGSSVETQAAGSQPLAPAAEPPSDAPAPRLALRGSMPRVTERPARVRAAPEATPPEPQEAAAPPPIAVQPPPMVIPPAAAPIRPATPPPADPDAPIVTREPYGD